jgi:hypothetical protein
MPEAGAVEAAGAGAVEAAAVVEAAEAEGGPAVAVSPEAAVAVVPGQAEGTSPDQGEADHLALPEVLIVPVWSVLAPGVPQISNEEMAVEFLPETRFHAIGLPGNAWLTARLNYRHRDGSTAPTSIGPRPGPGLGKVLPIGRVPGLGKGSPIGRVPGLGKGSPIGRATGTSAIS